MCNYPWFMKVTNRSEKIWNILWTIEKTKSFIYFFHLTDNRDDDDNDLGVHLWMCRSNVDEKYKRK